jgi:hypothetical protein
MLKNAYGKLMQKPTMKYTVDVIHKITFSQTLSTIN